MKQGVLLPGVGEATVPLRSMYIDFLRYALPLARERREEKVALHWLVKLLDIALSRRKYAIYQTYAQRLLSIQFPVSGITSVDPEIVWDDEETAEAISWVSWKYPVPSRKAKRFIYFVRDRISGAPIGVVWGTAPPLYLGGRLSVLPELDGRDGKGAYAVNRFICVRRIGTIEPFSHYLTGKLLALSFYAKEVQSEHERRYGFRYIAVEVTNLFGTSAVYHRLRLPSGRKAIYGKSYTAGEGDILIRISSLFPQGKLQKIYRIPELRPLLRHGFQREYLILSLTRNDLRAELFNPSPAIVSYPWDEIVKWWRGKWFRKRTGKPYPGRSFHERIRKELEWIERLREAGRDPMRFGLELHRIFLEMVWEELGR